MTEQDSAIITMRLLSVIRYLHSNGLVHRSLRPDMILFENEISLYDLKVVDLLSMTHTSPEGSFADHEQDEIYEKLTDGSVIHYKAPDLLIPT